MRRVVSRSLAACSVACLFTSVASAQTPPPPPAQAAPPPGSPPPGYPPPGAPPPYPAPAYAPPPPGYYPSSEESRERAEEQAEAAKASRNVALATNMLNLAINYFGLEVGVRLTDFMSLNANAGYWSYKDTSLVGLGFGAQFFPVSGKTFKGFYLYPSFVYFKGKTTSSVTVSTGTGGTTTQTAESTGSTTGIGMTLGYQWLLRFGLLFRVGGGLVRYSSGDSTSSLYAVTLPNVDGHIGFAF